jgi:hypothetical protein
MPRRSLRSRRRPGSVPRPRPPYRRPRRRGRRATAIPVRGRGGPHRPRWRATAMPRTRPGAGPTVRRITEPPDTAPRAGVAPPTRRWPTPGPGDPPRAAGRVTRAGRRRARQPQRVGNPTWARAQRPGTSRHVDRGPCPGWPSPPCGGLRRRRHGLRSPPTTARGAGTTVTRGVATVPPVVPRPPRWRSGPRRPCHRRRQRRRPRRVADPPRGPSSAPPPRRRGRRAVRRSSPAPRPSPTRRLRLTGSRNQHPPRGSSICTSVRSRSWPVRPQARAPCRTRSLG